MPDTLYDGSYLKPEAIGARRMQYPFRNNGDRVSALFEEDYWQRESVFFPQELSTPHESLTDFYLIGESEPQRFGFGDLVKFTRIYSRVPSQQVEHSSILITIPQPSAAGGGEGSFRFAGETDLLGEKTYLTPNWVFAKGSYYGPIRVSTSHRLGGVLTVPNHGMIANSPLVVIYDYSASGNNASTGGFWAVQHWEPSLWSNTNANAVSFSAFNTNYIGYLGVAQFSRGSLGSGSRYIRCKRITDFYLPGISPGIATVDDIPLPQDEGDSDTFLAALLAGTGTINVQVGELSRWRDSPIHMITKTTVSVADMT